MINTLLQSAATSIRLMLLFTLLLGGIYPLVVTVLAQAVFNSKANGSLIEKDGKVAGSQLLGQQFENPKYFWGRLSATSPAYNAASSAASNFSYTNPKLLEAANIRMAALQKAEPANKELIPVDLITASASGLDPHISVAALQYQLPRVAGKRNMRTEDVQALVDKFTDSNGFGLLGEPYVNVLELNMALDGFTGAHVKKKEMNCAQTLIKVLE